MKNDGVRQLDDFSIPNWMESQQKIHGSNHHQPVISWIYIYIETYLMAIEIVDFPINSMVIFHN